MNKPSIVETHPEVAAEWDYEKNEEGDGPENYTHGSNKKKWWKCKEGHSWCTTINSRCNGCRCLTCNYNNRYSFVTRKLTEEEAVKKDEIVGFKRLESYINSNTKVLYQCPFCPNTLYVKPQYIWSGNTKSCGCLNTKNLHRNFFENISGSYFRSIFNGAKRRGLIFSITIEDAWNQFVKQNGKCAESGRDIVLSRSTNKKCNTYQEQTASLDRIDSSKGYTVDNIQWVHKDIQKMKMGMSQDDFHMWCKLVAEYNNGRTSKN